MKYIDVIYGEENIYCYSSTLPVIVKYKKKTINIILN